MAENKWRAARFGLDCDLVTDAHGGSAPARQVVRDLLGELAPAARRLGCTAELDLVGRILDVGASYERQRAHAAREGWQAVPLHLAGELPGRPSA